jgi:cell division protein FtsW (lipid II flippase)
LTGVPLPLISSGGSSLIILLAAFGILVRISKYSMNHE